MYHNFGEPAGGDDPARLFVEPETLRRQLALLRKRGWRALNLDEFLSALNGDLDPGRSFLLTIDDGHESVLRHAAPILAEARVPSVLFVPPAALGGPVTWSPAYSGERLCLPAEIASLAGLGMEVGVHSWDHSSMCGMTPEQLHLHVLRARDEVSAIIGYLPRSFAYPFGAHDVFARKAVSAAGFAVGFAVAKSRGRYAFDRVSVNGSESPLLFMLKLSVAYRLACRAASRAPWLRHRHRVKKLLQISGRPRGSSGVSMK
jgi:peptidoglycan/xylan/chitin deacetylase (PgdA/CDA1 family)